MWSQSIGDREVMSSHFFVKWATFWFSSAPLFWQFQTECPHNVTGQGYPKKEFNTYCLVWRGNWQCIAKRGGHVHSTRWGMWGVFDLNCLNGAEENLKIGHFTKKLRTWSLWIYFTNFTLVVHMCIYMEQRIVPIF